MIDKLRQWMNQNSSVVTVVSIVVLLGALAFLVRGGKGSGPGAPGKAYYYDTVTGEVFTDVTTKVAPFTRANGNEAVRAHFFTCGDCTAKTKDEGGERFIGYYEKYTDEVKARLEERGDSFMIYEMAFQGRLYSKDGKEWVPADQPAGTAITSELQQECPPRQLRYCPPS